MSQRGTPLNSQARDIILKVKDYFQREKAAGGFITPVQKVQERLCDATGISRSSIYRIDRQKQSKGATSTPNKTRERKKPVQPDDFDREAIRRTIHKFYFRKELPTLDKLLAAVKDDVGFKGRRTALWELLKDLGFKYHKQNNRKYLTERNEVVALRHHYLRTIRDIRRQPGPPTIIYLDETWVNAHSSVDKCWLEFGAGCHEAGKGGFQVSTGKGKCLIVLHAGTENGFIQGAKDTFVAKKDEGDYHQEMNAQHFEEWLINQLFPNIPAGSIIVMDNASYHSKNAEENINSNSTRARMIEWLNNHNIVYSARLTRPELYEIIKRHKPLSQKKRVDELAKQHGHQVVRLPPYHCELNPIELIWAQVKYYVKTHNTTFKIADVHRLFDEALQHVTPENWANAVDHVKEIEERMWQEAGALDDCIQQMIISTDQDSSSDDSEVEHTCTDEPHCSYERLHPRNLYHDYESEED